MTRAQQIKEIQDAIAKSRKRISSSFLQGVNQIRESETLKKVLSKIRDGDYTGAMSLVDERMIRASFTPFTNAITTSARTGGAIGSEMFTSVGIGVHFSVVNPFVANYLNSYNMGLIRQITSETRKTIKQVMTRGVNAGDNPLKVARVVRDTIGLSTRQEEAVWNYRRALEERTRAALDRALRDRRFDSSILTAIANEKDLPQSKIDSMVNRYRERYVKYRSETIARTEATRSVNAGKQLMFEQAVNDGEVNRNQIRRFWIYTHDDKVRDSHAAIPDLNPDGVGMDEPFLTGAGNRLMFPCDPSAPPEDSINCRCSLYMRVVVD